jgi:hypothetical protein
MRFCPRVAVKRGIELQFLDNFRIVRVAGFLSPARVASVDSDFITLDFLFFPPKQRIAKAGRLILPRSVVKTTA